MIALSNFFWNILLIGRTILNNTLQSKQKHQGVWHDWMLLHSVCNLCLKRLKREVFWDWIAVHVKLCSVSVMCSVHLFCFRWVYMWFLYCCLHFLYCNPFKYNCMHLIGRMSASVRPSLFLRKWMPEKDGYAEDKYARISRNAVWTRLWIYFHEQEFVSLPPFPSSSSLTPSNLDLNFFLPILGASDLCPAWVLTVWIHRSCTSFFLHSVAILPLTFVRQRGALPVDSAGDT